MNDVRWLFFDLGNTLIDEGEAWKCRLRLLVEALERHGMRYSAEAVQATLASAAAEFAPRFIIKATEKLVDGDECRRQVLVAARYRKELEAATRPPNPCFVPCRRHTNSESSQTNRSPRRSGQRGGA